MIKIQETKHCDSRALNEGEELTEKAVKYDTELHIEAVQKCGDFFRDMIKGQFKEHDHTKLGDNLSEFTEALRSRLKNDEFKNLPWWKKHLEERHHLNDKVPEDVNLIDVIEMICDCVSAGMARTGKAYDVTLSEKVLKKAFDNTVELLKKNIEVEKPDEKDEAMKLFGLDKRGN